MLNASPKVSVVMAVHNDESHLRSSIESVLSQTMNNFEFIIIDDHSNDASTAIAENIKDKRIKIVRNETNIGLTKSLNRGLCLARGKYIARLDSDDNASPCRLEIQSEILDSMARTEMVAGSCSVVDDKGRCLYVHKPPTTETSLKWLMIFRNPIRHSTVMWRNGDLRYNEEFTYSQDYELWSRMRRIKTFDINFASVRTHLNSISSKKTEDQDFFATMVTKRKCEIYLKKEISLRRAKILRSLCVHRNNIQHDDILNASESEVEQALEDYSDLVMNFINEEKPDMSELKRDIMSDSIGIVRVAPKFKALVERFLFG
jgi:glycosyltransferase involved in cell wall biosynthesis